MRAMKFMVFMILLLIPTQAFSGPFTQEGIASDDPSIIGWATGWENYQPADSLGTAWTDPEKALGPASGNHFDVVSLGEREAVSDGLPGQITLTFDVPIENTEGPDLAIFENAFAAGDLLFGEFAYVEISSDGVNFFRFPCVSLTEEYVGEYGYLDPTNIFNLAGRYQNAYGVFLGTPFDFDDFVDSSAVINGDLDLTQITHVKIVDIPGSGEYNDEAPLFGYDEIHAIYDAYPTVDSAGFDLEAVAVVGVPVIDDDDDEDNSDDTNDEKSDDDSDGEKNDESESGCGT